VLKEDTNILEEYSASISSVHISTLKMGAAEPPKRLYSLQDYAVTSQKPESEESLS
jgi:hypothetical protein